MASTVLINLIFTSVIAIIAYFKYLHGKKDLHKYISIGFALFSLPFLMDVLRVSFYGKSEIVLISTILGYISIIYALTNK